MKNTENTKKGGFIKKSLFALLVCSLLLSSCTRYEENSNDSSDASNNSEITSSVDSSTDNSNVSEETSEEEAKMFDFSNLSKEELAEYITIGEYKGFESEKVVVVISEKEIDDKISSILETYGEWKDVTDKAIKKGDYVTMDFVGYLDGVAFEGGTGTNQSVTIGEGKYIPGFEDGLIGVKSGEKVNLNLTFPENYGNEDLKGKAVIFEVTVKGVKEFVIPEISEEIIKEYTEEKYTTIEDFRAYIKDDLYEKSYAQKLNLSKQEYWKKAVDNATVIKFPDGIIDEYVQAYLDYYSQYAAIYGVTLEEFLGKSVDEFKKECSKQAEASYKDNMVFYAAMYAEDYDSTIDEEKYMAWLTNYAHLTGTSVETLADQYSVETLQATYTFEAFIEHIYESRVETEPSSSEAEETTTSETTSETSAEE